MLTIHKRKQKKSSPFVVYEVFYNDNFFDYVWEPKNFKGPHKENFLVPPDAVTNPETFDEKIVDIKSWNWFHTLEEAQNYLLTSKFTNKL